MASLINTVGELKQAIAEAPDDQRVDVWYLDQTGKKMVAIGVSGENTDYSFAIYDTYTEAEAAIGSGEL
jgi:hypothetical protein